MTKKIITYTTSLVIAAAFFSCSKKGNITYEAKAVVEAYLQPGQKTQVKITREILAGESGTGDRTVNGLSVLIKHNGINYLLTQNSSGIYENGTMPVMGGESYELNFTYNGINITATTVVPDKPVNFTCSPSSITVPSFGGGTPPSSFPDPLKAKWNNTNAAYHLLTIVSVDAAASQIGNTGSQRPSFLNTPDQSNNKEVNFNAFKYYGRNALILYRMQPELAALYNSGGTNSQNLTTIPTNINNGLGIFTAVNIADTVFVTVN